MRTGSEEFGVVASWDEAVDNCVSVSGDGAAETARSVDQPPRFAKRRRLRVWSQVMIESGMLGPERRGADGQRALEQRERGEFGRGGEQAKLERVRASIGVRHDQRFRVGEPAVFFWAG